MTPEEIQALDRPKTKNMPNAEGKTMQHNNIIYKMMADGHDDATILVYLQSTGTDLPLASLAGRIIAISNNNFPARNCMTSVLNVKRVPANAVPVSRRQLSCALMTLESDAPEPGSTQDLIQKALPQILEKYPSVGWARKAFQQFHDVLEGGKTEALDAYIENYRDSAILNSFCKGLQMDKQAIQNAILHDMNSGFVEGGNNKIKVVKRVAYGRSNLPTLEAKCRAAFHITKVPNFDLKCTIQYPKRKGRLQVV